MKRTAKVSKQSNLNRATAKGTTPGVVIDSKPVMEAKPPVRESRPLHPLERPVPAPGKSVIKVGIDADLKCLVTTVQFDHGTLKPASRFTVEEFIGWVQARVAEGHVVWTVYEACGFGYTLHYRLEAVGANSLVMAAVDLDPQRHLKNDSLDSRALCTRLSRYVDGQKNELALVRVPTPEEEQRRETGRQREFWKGELQRLSSHGRALRVQHEFKGLHSRWWGPRKWPQIAAELSPCVRTFLAPLRELILECQKQLQLLTAEVEARVAGESIPKGLGALSLALFDAEVCDPFRFTNRKQVGSYTGCCPREHSSGGTQRFGGIDRHGNKHLRTILVEAVWRLLRYQPEWHAYKKLLGRLNAGVALKKKTVIALARQLAIDLWRVRTGQETWMGLGLVPK